MIKYTKEHIIIDDGFIRDNDVGKIIAPVYQNISIYDSTTKYLDDLKKFTKEQVLVSSVWLYETEVSNGGHKQFFYNSTGIVYIEAVEAFSIMAAVDYKDLLDLALIRMGNGISREREVRVDYLEKEHPTFEDIDDKFFLLEVQKPINDLLKEYILRNASKFYYEGIVEVSDFAPKKFLEDFQKTNK